MFTFIRPTYNPTPVSVYIQDPYEDTFYRERHIRAVAEERARRAYAAALEEERLRYEIAAAHQRRAAQEQARQRFLAQQRARQQMAAQEFLFRRHPRYGFGPSDGVSYAPRPQREQDPLEALLTLLSSEPTVAEERARRAREQEAHRIAQEQIARRRREEEETRRRHVEEARRRTQQGIETLLQAMFGINEETSKSEPAPAPTKKDKGKAPERPRVHWASQTSSAPSQEDQEAAQRRISTLRHHEEKLKAKKEFFKKLFAAPAPSQALKADQPKEENTQATSATEATPSQPAEKQESSRPSSPALSTISTLEHDLDVLRSAFTFPSHLSFTDSPKLPFTRENATVLEHEQALNNLLAKIDEIDSGGAEDIRHKRRSLVRRVEEELDALDRKKEQARKEQLDKGEGPSGIIRSPVVHPVELPPVSPTSQDHEEVPAASFTSPNDNEEVFAASPTSQNDHEEVPAAVTATPYEIGDTFIPQQSDDIASSTATIKGLLFTENTAPAVAASAIVESPDSVTAPIEEEAEHQTVEDVSPVIESAEPVSEPTIPTTEEELSLSDPTSDVDTEEHIVSQSPSVGVDTEDLTTSVYLAPAPQDDTVADEISHPSFETSTVVEGDGNESDHSSISHISASSGKAHQDDFEFL